MVGHPIDVVTGANADSAVDFTLTGPLPLHWRRYYNSADNRTARSLGWGHSHDFERLLRYDLDGLRYTGPDGGDTEFPPLDHEGARTSAVGFTLIRIGPDLFRLSHAGDLTAEFLLAHGESAAPLARLVQGTHSIVFSYAQSGLLEKIRDSQGRLLRVEHNSEGRVRSVVRTHVDRGRSLVLISYDYDEAGNLIRGTDAYGHSFGFSWDAQNRMTSSTDRRGYSFLFEYDDQGRCVRSRGKDGLLEVRLAYHPTENKTVVTRADGGQWTYRYNDAAIVTEIADPYGDVTSFQLGEDGRVVEEVDPTGNAKRYVYDAAGAQLGTRDTFGRFSGLEESETEPEVPEEPMAREFRDIEVPECAAECDYGDLIDLDAVSLPRAGDPVFRHLPSWAKSLVKTARKNESKGPVHAARREELVGEEDRRGVRSVRDELGTVVREVWPDGTSCRWTYDPNGNTRRYIDREGSEYTYEWKSWNLLARETDPLGHTSKYEYTPSEKVAAIVDPCGTRTDYQYDLKDRIIGIHRHGVATERYEYDAANNLTAKLDAAEEVVLSYEIGLNNLKKTEQLASGEKHSYDYDEQGRVTRAVTEGCEVECAYSDSGTRILDLRNGRGVQHELQWGGLVETKVLGRFKITYEEQDDGSVVVRDPSGASHTIRVLEAHGLVLRTMSNGISEVSQYDHDGRCLLRAIGSDSKASARTVQYRYSPEGELREVRNSHLGQIEYNYDAHHRLSGVQRTDVGFEEIAYDEADNLLRKHGLRGVKVVGGNRLVAANGEQVEYDSHGRMSLRRTSRGIYRYAYNARGWLTGVETPEGEWRADYDPLGRRASCSFGSGRREFFWDNDRLAAEMDETGQLRVYLYADLFAVVPIVVLEYESVDVELATGTRSAVFCSEVSAPILLLDDGGEVVWRASYEPYGVHDLRAADASRMPLRFPGQYADTETGLCYNRFRYYIPDLGRYLQPDPLGCAGALNLYGYTHDPLTEMDFLGLKCKNRRKRGRRKRRKRRERRERNPAKLARDVGMDPRVLENLRKRAKKRGETIIVRSSNQESLKWHKKKYDGQKCKPKPIGVKAKTAKPPDPHAGLVKAKPPPPPGHTIDNNGVLRDRDGSAMYGDHDLQGVYKNGKGQPTNDPGFQRNMNKDMNRGLDKQERSKMVQHGANDDHRNPETGKPERQPGKKEKYLVVEPDGTAKKINSTEELNDYYKRNGNVGDWPY
jgi:RHS repeat-associated protein